jgi:hypothetical protein
MSHGKKFVEKSKKRAMEEAARHDNSKNTNAKPWY